MLRTGHIGLFESGEKASLTPSRPLSDSYADRSGVMRKEENTYRPSIGNTSYPGFPDSQVLHTHNLVTGIRIGWIQDVIDRFDLKYVFSKYRFDKEVMSKKRKYNVGIKRQIFIVAILTMLISGMNLQAQNFRNTGGVYKGQGLFRVQNEATGLPDTVSGTFEYFGGNQQVEAKSFENLLLSGDSTKATTDINIINSVAIADGVRFQVGSLMTLDKSSGRITSEAGLIIGRVTKTVDLNLAPDSADFGGIGMTVSSQGSAPGTTDIVRTSGPAGVVSSNGNNSIQRTFHIQPANPNGLAGTIYFRYSVDELGGNDSLTLEVWRSPDGSTWRRQRTMRNNNALVRSGRFLSGYWTAADADHLLGRPNYEFDPDSVIAAGPDSLRGRVNNQLDSLFTAQITDVYGNIIPNALIRFQITSVPLGASGQSLSDTLVATDAQGMASTRLLLGNRIGEYVITAQAVSSPSAQKIFRGYASSGIYALRMAVIPPTDTIKQIVGPFSVDALDEFSGGVPFAGVQFTITPPAGSGAMQQAILPPDTIANASGSAQAWVKLGEKVGDYTIEVRSIENDTVFTTFTIRATHGIPALAWQRGTIAYTDTINKVLPRFVYAITDSDTNAVGGHSIAFSIISKPDSATGDTLINPFSTTDSTTGEASVALQLGNKVGDYVVRIEDPAVTNSARLYTGTAVPGSARILAYMGGRDQSKQILNVLDNAFVARISDDGGNPIAGVPVQFSVTDTPSGAWGHSLTRMIDTTDASGNARTYLKLGSKIGNYSVSASSPSITPTIIPFNATALVGAANIVNQNSGNIQVGQIGDLLNPFIVQVSDTGGNLVPNTTVNFAVTNRPPASIGDSVTIAVATTDSLGLANSSLILGDKQGRYIVRASIPNGRDTLFTAYAILLLADANHDNRRNVGDLTAIIDHAIGRRILTGRDFSRADMYPVRPDGTVGDGMVDNRDAQVCLDSLRSAQWDPVRDWMLTPEAFLGPLPTTAVLSDTSAPMEVSTVDSCYIQLTFIGSRFLLKNSVPVKGLQAIIYTRNQVSVDTMDIIFPRASMMTTKVRTIGNAVNILMWNYSNTPIGAGDSPIFRLPVQLSSSNVDSIHVVVSTTDSNTVTLLASSSQDIRNSIPNEWRLYQNYPNPFNPSTTIEFDVPEVQGKIPRVAIQIFNILGQKVRTLEPGVKDAKRYRVVWNGTNDNGTLVASGVYFYRLLAGDYVSTKKMVMLK